MGLLDIIMIGVGMSVVLLLVLISLVVLIVKQSVRDRVFI